MSRRTQESSCLCFPRRGITGIYHSAGLLHVSWGIELKSPSLLSKHLISRADSKPLLVICVLLYYMILLLTLQMRRLVPLEKMEYTFTLPTCGWLSPYCCRTEWSSQGRILSVPRGPGQSLRGKLCPLYPLGLSAACLTAAINYPISQNGNRMDSQKWSRLSAAPTSHEEL